jgi:hypothetical protein
MRTQLNTNQHVQRVSRRKNLTCGNLGTSERRTWKHQQYSTELVQVIVLQLQPGSDAGS